jgi:hypothetical protein
VGVLIMPSVINYPFPTVGDPVGQYYRGKALRADTALKEKQTEVMQQEIEAFGKPDPKEQRDAINHATDGLAEAGAETVQYSRLNPDATEEKLASVFTDALYRTFPSEVADAAA